MGATASGKTAAAFYIADHFPVEIISVDSAQVFCGMNIGTSKPSANELAKYPHHLINLIAPEKSYSAALFCADALKVMAEITARGKIPLLVGGTMLYFKALIDGLSDLPKADLAIRQSLDEKIAQEGITSLYADLQKCDPITAARLKPADSQRICRALEIFLASGKSMSAWLADENNQGKKAPYRFLNLGLSVENRAALHGRIGARFHEMLKNGFVEEVQNLRKNYALNADLPSMRCVGYRQIWDVLEGLSPENTLAEKGIAATRQLAKRQLTWMNNTLMPEKFDFLDANLNTKIAARIDQFMGVKND